MAAFLVKVVDHMTDFSVVEDTCKVKKKEKKTTKISGLKQVKKGNIPKLKNLDLLQYQDCNVRYKKFYGKYFQTLINNPYIILSKRQINLSK